MFVDMPLGLWIVKLRGLERFFYCDKCKVKKAHLRNLYVNADGIASTDSDSE